jgi:hypothetical protein
MPQIPADFRVDRSPFAAGDIRAEANPAAFAAAGRGLAEAGQAISEEGQRWGAQYAEALRQKQAANLTFDGMSAPSQSQEKWSRVPNSQQALAGFNDESEQIRNRTVAQTSDPEVQAMVLRSLTEHTLWSQLGVQNRSFALESSNHRAEIDQQLEGYQQQAAAAPDAITRASIVDRATANIRGAVAAGWMYGEQGEDRLSRFRNQVWGDAVVNGLRTNPQQTLAEIDRGDYAARLSPETLDRLQPAIERAQIQTGANRVGREFGFGGAVGAGAPLNNPGNIRAPGGGFQQFSSYDEGLAAIRQNLGAYQDEHGVNTLAGVIGRWSPPSENPTDQLIANASRRTGFAPDQVLNLHDPATTQKLVDAIVTQEQGGRGPPPGSVAAAGAPPALDQAAAKISNMVDSGEVSPRVGEGMISELHRRYDVWQTATHQARWDLSQSLRDGAAALADGRDWDIPTAQIRRLLPPDQADQAISTLNEAHDAGQAKLAVQWADPQQLADIQTRAMTRLNDPAAADYARNRRYAEQIAGAITQRQQLLNQDPAAYVRMAPAVDAAYQKVDPNNPAPGTQAAIAASLALQARLGVPDQRQRALTAPLAARLAQSIANHDPATVDMPAQIDQLARLYGRYWPQAFGEAVKAGLPADYQVLGTMDMPGQIVAAGDYQRMLGEIAAKGGAQKLKEAAPPEAVKAIDQDLPGEMADFRATIRDPVQYRIFAGAVQNLARYYAYRGDGPSAALQKAYDGIIGQRWDMDGQLRTPRGMLALAQDAARSVQDSVNIDRLGPVPGNPQLTPEQRQYVYQEAIKRGFWATNEADDGAVLMLRYMNGGVAPAQLADGKRLEFKFAEAPRLAAWRFAQPAPSWAEMAIAAGTALGPAGVPAAREMPERLAIPRGPQENEDLLRDQPITGRVPPISTEEATPPPPMPDPGAVP